MQKSTAINSDSSTINKKLTKTTGQRLRDQVAHLITCLNAQSNHTVYRRFIKCRD